MSYINGVVGVLRFEFWICDKFIYCNGNYKYLIYLVNIWLIY